MEVYVSGQVSAFRFPPKSGIWRKEEKKTGKPCHPERSGGELNVLKYI